MKIGVSLKIDVKKIDKARLFAAQSGASYLDLTMFLDTDNAGQYGDHGFITQSTTKEEREQNIQMPILGNGKIFYGLNDMNGNDQGYQQSQQQGGYQQSSAPQQQKGYQKPQFGGGNSVKPLQSSAPKINPQGPTIDFDDDIPFN